MDSWFRVQLNRSDDCPEPDVAWSNDCAQQFAADFALSRYQANGELDPRFGNSGTATVDFGETREAVSALVPQGNGIVAAGYASSEAVARSPLAEQWQPRP